MEEAHPQYNLKVFADDLTLLFLVSNLMIIGLQEAMGPLKESAVWVDETIFLNMAFGRKRPLSPSGILQEDPLGLSTEGNE